MTEENRNIQSSDPATGKRWAEVTFIPVVLKTLAIGASCVGLWLYLDYRSPRSIGYATEQRDGSENRVVKTKPARIGEDFTLFKTNLPAASFAAAWPCFRGMQRDNLVRDTQPLTKSWDDFGPKIMWRADLGEGYAGAIIAKNRVYVLDYWEEKNADALRCFDLLSGAELWRRSYKNPIRRNHGKSRTVPAYADNVVVSLGPAGHVMAVDARSGDLLWSCDLVATYKCEVPQWYAGQCPLIDGQKVILGIGGEKVLVAAFDLKTGNTVWELPNDGAFKMSHASILSAKLLNRGCYVYAALGGIAACDRDGQPLWCSTAWKPAVPRRARRPPALPDRRLWRGLGDSVPPGDRWTNHRYARQAVETDPGSCIGTADPVAHRWNAFYDSAQRRRGVACGVGCCESRCASGGRRFQRQGEPVRSRPISVRRQRLLDCR